VEPLSLDEAYLDVTGLNRYAWDIAKEIRQRIFAETRLTASAGIAPNKMLAKIASDWRKPNGQFAVTPEQIDTFVRDLPVRKIWGVGPKSAAKFEQQGIRTCGDLQKLDLPELVRRHGKWGHELFRLCRGLDDREVQPDRIRKSLSNECTYTDNLTTLEQCRAELDKLVDELEQELRAKARDRPIRKALVKVKFADFSRTTKECVSTNPTRETYHALLAEAFQRSPHPVRLLGAGVRFAEEDIDEASQAVQQVLRLRA
jgi:DNA polymerase-4